MNYASQLAECINQLSNRYAEKQRALEKQRVEWENIHTLIKNNSKAPWFSPTLSFPSLKFGSITYKIQVEDKVTIMAIESKSTSNLSSIIPSNTVMEDMINSYCSILNSLYR